MRLSKLHDSFKLYRCHKGKESPALVSIRGLVSDFVLANEVWPIVVDIDDVDGCNGGAAQRRLSTVLCVDCQEIARCSFIVQSIG